MRACGTGIGAAALAAVFAVAGCSREEPPPYNLTNNMQFVMQHVLDPAADAVWGASGYVITEEGEQDLSPKTVEEWERVETGAGTVAEIGNLLMTPGRAPEGEADWLKHAQAMTAAALKAQKAAETQNKEGVFDYGGEMYQACLACHEQYVTGEANATVNAEGGS